MPIRFMLLGCEIRRKYARIAITRHYDQEAENGDY